MYTLYKGVEQFEPAGPTLPLSVNISLVSLV